MQNILLCVFDVFEEIQCGKIKKNGSTTAPVSHVTPNPDLYFHHNFTRCSPKTIVNQSVSNLACFKNKLSFRVYLFRGGVSTENYGVLGMKRGLSCHNPTHFVFLKTMWEGLESNPVTRHQLITGLAEGDRQPFILTRFTYGQFKITR